MKKLAILVCILSLTLLTLYVSMDVYSQSSPEAERRPRPIPPSCCRPFRADDFSSADLEAVPRITWQPHLVLGGGSIVSTNSMSNSGAVPRPTVTIVPSPAATPENVEREDIERYRLNLEEYRLITETLKRKDAITRQEYNRRINWYRLRVSQYKRENL